MEVLGSMTIKNGSDDDPRKGVGAMVGGEDLETKVTTSLFLNLKIRGIYIN